MYLSLKFSGPWGSKVSALLVPAGAPATGGIPGIEPVKVVKAGVPAGGADPPAGVAAGVAVVAALPTNVKARSS